MRCLALLAVSLLAACGHDSGNTRLTPALVANIRAGVTTKEQVRALLGAPQSTKTQLPLSQPAGAASLPAKLTASEIWGFWRDRRKSSFPRPFADAAAGTARYLVIVYFDDRGTVLDCQSEGKSPGKD